MGTENDERCPVRGGRFGEDWRVHDEDCELCRVRELCRQRHDHLVRERRKDTTFPLRLEIPRGLFEVELSPLERELVALVAYRVNRYEWAYGSNEKIGRLLGFTGQHVGNVIRDLVRRRFLISSTIRLKRKGANQPKTYRSSRKLQLGREAIRAIYRYRLEKDFTDEPTE